MSRAGYIGFVLSCTLALIQVGCLRAFPAAADLTPLALLGGGSSADLDASASSGSGTAEASGNGSIEITYDSVVRSSGASFHLDFEATGSTGPAAIFLVKNNGTGALVINNVSETSGNVSEFTLDTAGMNTTVASGATTSFTVAFAPTTTGNFTMQLTVDSDDGSNGSIVFNFSGTGVTQLTHVTTGGNDGSGDGSKGNPYLTIQHALNNTSAGGMVRVGQGTYNVASAINLVNGVGLAGGYNTGDWTQDISGTPTTVQGVSTAPGSGLAPIATFISGGGVSNSTNLIGLYINGTTSGSTYTAAVVLSGGSSPKITRCEMIGGGGSTSYGMYIEGGSDPAVSQSTIGGGSGSLNSTGVSVRDGGSDPALDRNTIDGGSGATARGVFVDGASGTFTNNSIRGGTAGSGTDSAGVYLNGAANSQLLNNTINGADYTSSSAAYVASNGGSVWRNNILFTDSPAAGSKYCLFELLAANDPGTFENNLLFDCNTALYFDADTSASITSIASVNGLGDITSSGNVSTNPMFADQANHDYRLTASTPVAVRQGGQDLSGSGITFDRNGVSRTVPYSIGAFEHD